MSSNDCLTASILQLSNDHLVCHAIILFWKYWIFQATFSLLFACLFFICRQKTDGRSLKCSFQFYWILYFRDSRLPTPTTISQTELVAHSMENRLRFSITTFISHYSLFHTTKRNCILPNYFCAWRFSWITATFQICNTFRFALHC